MNASQTIHPTDQTLQSYGLGKLDDLLVEVVSQHLDSCADCRRRVAELSSDSFLGKLRDGQGRPGASDPMGSPTGKESRRPSETLPPGLANHPDYEILRELGRGGMGVVYLAQNRLMGRQEVLKVVSSQLVNQPGVMDRFLGEIRNAARLHHPNIVMAYSALRCDENLVLAMEYVEGLDLARMVKAKGPLPVAHACYFIHQAALGLQHAYENGMVHRDIKPDNLMLMRAGNRAVIKILDFGLAKVRRERTTEGTLTAAGQWLGTPEYIAPEQIHDARQADIRADIYSLGCTFYYLLTGRPPFQATTLYEIYQAHHSMDAPMLNMVRPDVPMELAILVATMMAKEPERRFQTPREVSQALAPFLKKENPAAQDSKPEVSLANATMPQRQAAGMGPVPMHPTMNVAPVPAPPAQAGSHWETLVETGEAKGLSDEIQAMREKDRGVPVWLWPAVAAGLLLVGLGVGWGLRTNSGTTESGRGPVPSLASSPPAKPTVPVRPAPDPIQPPPSTPARTAGDLKAPAEQRIATSFDRERPAPAEARRRVDADSIARAEPADTRPAPTKAGEAPKPAAEAPAAVAEAPKAKPEEEPVPADASPEEVLLVKRGLKKVGMFYVVPTEDEIAAGYLKVVPYYNVMEAAMNELAQAVQIENYVRELDDTRINLRAYINDLNAQLGSLPNTVVNRLARQSIQQEIQLAQANLGNANREYAIAIKRVVPPRKKQALTDEFQKRRADFLDATKELRPTVDKAMKEYNEIKKDPEVTSAIRVLKEKAKAPLAIGPSAGFKKAVANLKSAEQMVSYNPEAYNIRKKRRLEQGPKGKMPSMPSGKTGGQ
ncbi:MAG: protein kinase domain-containing protein [Isosphaeraceae bacterium]